MSLNDILMIERERVLRERVVLDSIYERAKNRINIAVKMKEKDCVYTVPEMIIGLPLVNVEKAINFLLVQLQKNGFIALKLNERQVYISWNPDDIRRLDEQSRNVDSRIQFKTDDDRSGGFKEIDKNIEKINTDFIDSIISIKKKNKA